MKSSYTQKHKLYPYGYQISTSLESALKPGELSRLVHACLTSFKDLLLDRKELINLKGRDSNNIMAPQLRLSSPKHQELIWIKGLIPSSEDTESQIIFNFSVESQFASFPNSQQIAHTITQHRVNLPEYLEASLIGWCAPIIIKEFRLGIETFRPKRFSALLGSAPVVNEILLIEANEENLFLTTNSEGLKSKHNLPLQYLDIYSRLKHVLAYTFKLDLAAITEPVLASLFTSSFQTQASKGAGLKEA